MNRSQWAALALAAGAMAAWAQASAADAARGKSLYLKNMCDACHGSVGQGLRYGPRLVPPLPMQAFEQQVRHPRAAMPRYPAEHVSDQDLADMVAYLGSAKAEPKASDIPLLKE